MVNSLTLSMRNTSFGISVYSLVNKTRDMKYMMHMRHLSLSCEAHERFWLGLKMLFSIDFIFLLNKKPQSKYF